MGIKPRNRCSRHTGDAKTSESTALVRAAKIVRMLEKKGVTGLVQLEMDAVVLPDAKAQVDSSTVMNAGFGIGAGECAGRACSRIR